MQKRSDIGTGDYKKRFQNVRKKGYKQSMDMQETHKRMYFECISGEMFDCADILQKYPASENGVYTVYPLGEAVCVFCDMVTDSGGWTVRIKCTIEFSLLSSIIQANRAR